MHARIDNALQSEALANNVAEAVELVVVVVVGVGGGSGGGGGGGLLDIGDVNVRHARTYARTYTCLHLKYKRLLSYSRIISFCGIRSRGCCVSGASEQSWKQNSFIYHW